jgi:hypothetical protein
MEVMDIESSLNAQHIGFYRYRAFLLFPRRSRGATNLFHKIICKLVSKTINSVAASLLANHPKNASRGRITGKRPNAGRADTIRPRCGRTSQLLPLHDQLTLRRRRTTAFALDFRGKRFDLIGRDERRGQSQGRRGSTCCRRRQKRAIADRDSLLTANLNVIIDLWTNRE